MRVTHIARHGCGDNDDEGAIGYALEQLGHSVQRVHEAQGVVPDCDFALFHAGWSRFELLHDVCAAYWHFDCFANTAEAPSGSRMASWLAHRQSWSKQALQVAKGFHTDGDWAASVGAVHLLQGADERKTCYEDGAGGPKVLFTGTRHHGTTRLTFVQEMEQKYGSDFLHHGERPRQRSHGKELANLLQSAAIVVAPDGPHTDRYWSNRVYLSLGFGAFLLHPKCAGLREHYTEDELVMYSSREELHEQIAYFLARPAKRREYAKAGYEATIRKHLYRHRCERLVHEVRSGYGMV